jgi:hypothetical protein
MVETLVEDARCAPSTRRLNSGLWLAINLSLCRHAVAIVAFKEVAEWDTPLTFNQNGSWASLAQQRTISNVSVQCLGGICRYKL